MKHSIIKILLLFSVLISCRIVGQSLKELPDEIRIYRIPQFKNYIVGVKCGELKVRDEATLLIIKDKRKILMYTSILDDSANFQLSEIVPPLDTRMTIQFIKDGKVISQVCWSRTGLIERAGSVYTYKPKVENFFLNEKLIIVFR